MVEGGSKGTQNLSLVNPFFFFFNFQRTFCKKQLLPLEERFVGLHFIFQIVHILNMTSAKILSFSLHPEESLHSLQSHIESETGISTGNQELLLEMGICLDPRKPASQCVIDGIVRSFSLEFHCLK